MTKKIILLVLWGILFTGVAWSVQESSAVDTLEQSETVVAGEPEKGSMQQEEHATEMGGLDTVFIFDKVVFQHVARDWQKNIDIFRKRGIGASGSSFFGVYAFLDSPIRDLVAHEPFFAGKEFVFSRYNAEPFLMTGGSGYIGLGEGFRIGGRGMSGQRKFLSSRFNGDSVLVLTIQVTCGGFMVENVRVNGPWNYVVGSTLGAGSMAASVAYHTNSFFQTIENQTILSTVAKRAHYLLLEPHGGFSYTFFPFFHVGAEVTVPTLMTLEKFSAYTTDFFTVNAGVSVKFIFGNLG